MNVKFIFFLILIAAYLCKPQSIPHTVIESNQDYIVLKFDFNNAYKLTDTVIDGKTFQKFLTNFSTLKKPGEPWLPEYFFSLGIPHNAKPEFQVISKSEIAIHNKFILPYPDYNASLSKFDFSRFDIHIYSTNSFFPESIVALQPVRTMRYAKLQTISISPFTFNPVSKELIFIKQLVIKIVYNEGQAKSSLLVSTPAADKTTEEFLRTSTLNFPVAKKWIAKKTDPKKRLTSNGYWYNPLHNYFKLFLKQKGMYRVSYEDLQAAGILIPSGLPSTMLEMHANGVTIPLDIYDGGDGTFDAGDYFVFFGEPPPASPFTRQNIYNTSNVYWLSFQGNSAEAARYVQQPMYTIDNTSTLNSSYRTDFYEKDVLFEHLGESPTGDCDYWFWDKTSAYNGKTLYSFKAQANNFLNLLSLNTVIKFKVNLQGMTNFNCGFDHKAAVSINGKQIGLFQWSGQTDSTFTGSFNPSTDAIALNAGGNTIQIETDGNICDASKTDDIRVNWFEFTYESGNIVQGKSYSFSSLPGSNGKTKISLAQWADTLIQIFAPASSSKFTGTFLHDSTNSVVFTDSVNGFKEYYAVSNSSFLSIDSIAHDTPSNLRSTGNGADYIIITHSKFKSIAERLKVLREKNFPDTSIVNPRITIANIDDIYDEFSYGLLDPLALQQFASYAFNNWVSPAPAYIVLLGDMSYDYRHIYATSRINYIPSIPYHSHEFGLAASDNGIVTVAGDDIIPDMAIGRLSIEEVSEGEILLNKLENYPADKSKTWRQNTLLFSSGLSTDDALQYGFNEANRYLDTAYIKRAGLRSKQVFRYPVAEDQFVYQGGVVEMKEAINDGGVLLNYYGHGGGNQWDQTFFTDDIYLLQNGGRLPVILNPTCYTAHYDNQDIFGEQFLKVPDKGCIGFFGSSGLTHWEAGRFINENIFTEFFTNKNYITGKVFLHAKALTPTSGVYADQIALLTYLGDPVLQLAFPKKVDFGVSENDITYSPSNPLANGSLQTTIHFHNYGIPASDSVTVQLTLDLNGNGTITGKRIPAFALEDSVTFSWIPVKGGLYSLKVQINPEGALQEEDLTDNTATIVIPVFNISEPNIITPANGLEQAGTNVAFRFADIVQSQSTPLNYFVEIDTALNFSQPLLRSSALTGSNGLLQWITPLSKNSYFWRTRIYDGQNYGKWSDTYSFAVGDSTITGSKFSGKQLKMLSRENMVYNATDKTLLLNKDYLSPKPSRELLIGEIHIDDSLTFSQSNMSVMATDGKYIYLGDDYITSASVNHDTTGKSYIYKIGTGLQGTIAGHNYGAMTNFNKPIHGQIVYANTGFLYIPMAGPYNILRINPVSEKIDTASIPTGLIEKESGVVHSGSFMLAADSNYIYNLAIKDSAGKSTYSLKIFDPANAWSVKQQYTYTGLTAFTDVTGFFVADGYIYVYENTRNGLMQKINITDDSDTLSWLPWKDNETTEERKFFAWTYDKQNNLIYASKYRPGIEESPLVAKFPARYLNPTGTVFSPVIGPASSWKGLIHNFVKVNNAGSIRTLLSGYNRNTKIWDTLATGISTQYDLSHIAPNVYQYIQARTDFTDSTFDKSASLGVASLQCNYSQLPEIMVTDKDIVLVSDTVAQGSSLQMTIQLRNVTNTPADSVTVSCKIDGSTESAFTKKLSIPTDSSAAITVSIPTSSLAAQTIHRVKITAALPNDDQFLFNNFSTKDFYIARDTSKPTLDITFDDKHIVNGDIVSPNPKIVISLADNISSHFDSTNVLMLLDNHTISYAQENITFDYTNEQTKGTALIWSPNFSNGTHRLKIQAKNANGNYTDTDSTFRNIEFTVYTENDIANVFPYPNPFKDDTYFTFELRGKDKPENIAIKVYTVAGRLIKTFHLDGGQFNLNFNKIYWDGRDQDGSEIANGVYLYKITTKFRDKTISSAYKIAKVK